MLQGSSLLEVSLDNMEKVKWRQNVLLKETKEGEFYISAINKSNALKKILKIFPKVQIR